ncbi:transcription termination factor 5, mitochondrial [Bradysia coprophila]|uniref:transcription termination factor 5, mitochondrial n=1 Tax=Bradysia coprophila TaxID=38358 RepID=UPI00187DB3F3|nr:transcription termination factor 5, mitochondrial [Bradysia coprophila]
MFCNKSFRLLLVTHLNLSKIYTFQRHNVSDKVKFLEKILDFGSLTATDKFLQKHDYLIDVDDGAVSDSIRYLKEIGTPIENIREQPEILCSDRITLKNRHEVLSECGCSNVNIGSLQHYNQIVRQTEASLKSLGIIDNNINLQERLASRLKVQLRPCKEDANLTAVRLHFLQLFFVDNGLMTPKEFNKAFRTDHVRQKSYQSTENILKILTEQLDIPKDKIRDYKQALGADPDTLQKLLTIQLIRGVNTKDFLKQNPSAMVLLPDSVQRTLKELEKVELSDESTTKYTNVLSKLMKLDPKDVHRRLKEMETQPHIQAMSFHPKFLKLILHYFKAEYRMKHMETVEKKCFNIDALTRQHSEFRKFYQRENDQHMERDCIRFLTTNLNIDAKQAKDEMNRHPYWKNVAFVDVKDTIDRLKLTGFELEDIRANVHIVLYSGDLIVSRFKKFSESEPFEGHSWTDLPKSVQLKLILYDIERERHFSGDGVWLDRKCDGSNLVDDYYN